MTVAEIAAGVGALSAVAISGAVIALVLRYRADVRRYADAIVDSLAREGASMRRAEAAEVINRSLDAAITTLRKEIDRERAAHRQLRDQIHDLQDTLDACRDPISVRDRLRRMLQATTVSLPTRSAGPGDRGR